MRIALIAAPLYGELQRRGGGPLSDLVLALRQRGNDITVFSTHPGGEAIDTELAGLPAHLIPAKKRRLRWYMADKVAKWMSGERKLYTDAACLNDFLHRRGPFDVLWALSEMPDSLTVQIAKELRPRLAANYPPLLTTVQAIRWSPARAARGKQPEQIKCTRPTAMKWSLLGSSIVAANSTLAEDWLREKYGQDEDGLARYPVNFSREFLELMTEPNLDPGDNAPIVFFGALNPTKGPDLFLEAAIRLVAEYGQDRRFVMIGGQTEKNPAFDRKLQNLQKHPSLQGRLEVTGRLPMAEIIPRLRDATMVVCPSRSDTFSRATIEALALGTPVVVSTHVGAREIIESELCGIVAPLEPGALAQAMRDALSERDTLAGYARATVAKLLAEHTPEAAAARIEQLLVQMISQGR